MWSLSLVLIIALLSVVESEKGWNKGTRHCLKHKSDYDHNNIDEKKEKDNNNNGGNPTRQEISDDPNQAFKDLVQHVTSFDQLSANYCEKNSHDGVMEMYGTNNYKLYVPLKNFDTDLLEIKIRYRVIFIKGEVPEVDPRWQSDDDAHFNDIRRLPHNLDVKKANWVLRNERIEVTIPYKFTLNTEIKNTCLTDAVDDEEFIVPEEKASGDVDQGVIDDIFGITTKQN